MLKFSRTRITKSFSSPDLTGEDLLVSLGGQVSSDYPTVSPPSVQPSRSQHVGGAHTTHREQQLDTNQRLKQEVKSNRADPALLCVESTYISSQKGCGIKQLNRLDKVGNYRAKRRRNKRPSSAVPDFANKPHIYNSSSSSNSLGEQSQTSGDCLPRCVKYSGDINSTHSESEGTCNAGPTPGLTHLERAIDVTDELCKVRPTKEKQMSSTTRTMKNKLDNMSSLHRTARASRSYTSKSMTNLFQETFNSFRKKDNPCKKRELSTVENVPGVLKIFCDGISPGARYKSVFATNSSTAKVLIDAALQRHGIPKDQRHHYVLCDVIGNPYSVHSDKAEDDEAWSEECIRIIDDNERPLVLQSFWKPPDHLARRFELRKRPDLILLDGDHGSDAVGIKVLTQPPGAMSKGKTRTEGKSQVTVDDHEHNLSDFLPRKQLDTLPAKRNKQLLECLTLRELSKQPFLLTLKSSNKDCNLVYLLKDRTTAIGSSFSSSTEADITLRDKSIQSEHCCIHRKVAGRGVGDADRIFIEPFMDANVEVNDLPISTTTELQSGDVISLGEGYTFLLVARKPNTDLTQVYSLPYPIKTISNEAPVCSDRFESHSNGHVLTCGSYLQGDQVNRTSGPREPYPRLKFAQQDLEFVLVEITTSVRAGHYPLVPSLTPAYLLVMMVEYAASEFDQEFMKHVLMKMTSVIEDAVWEKSKRLPAKDTSWQGSSPEAVFEELIPDLLPLILWITNSLELLHHLQHNLNNYLKASRGRPEEHMEVVSVREDVFSVLEEVVVFSFQRVVYYITMVLRSVLPSLLDTNPYGSGEKVRRRLRRHKLRDAISTVIGVYQWSLDTFLHHQVHPQIISQLFCYLAYFTSVSICNVILSKGPKYLLWTRGIQLRSNLDKLKEWADQYALGDEFNKCLSKVENMADMLSTSYMELQKTTWRELRERYKELNPAQIHHILTHYRIEAGHTRPEYWQPSEEDAKAASRNDGILDNFQNHPALKIPTKGFEVDLSRPPQTEQFLMRVAEINNNCLTLNYSGTDQMSDATATSTHCTSNLALKSPTKPTLPHRNIKALAEAPRNDSCDSEVSFYMTPSNSPLRVCLFEEPLMVSSDVEYLEFSPGTSTVPSLPGQGTSLSSMSATSENPATSFYDTDKITKDNVPSSTAVTLCETKVDPAIDTQFKPIGDPECEQEIYIISPPATDAPKQTDGMLTPSSNCGSKVVHNAAAMTDWKLSNRFACHGRSTLEPQEQCAKRQNHNQHRSATTEPIYMNVPFHRRLQHPRDPMYDSLDKNPGAPSETPTVSRGKMITSNIPPQPRDPAPVLGSSTRGERTKDYETAPARNNDDNRNVAQLLNKDGLVSEVDLSQPGQDPIFVREWDVDSLLHVHAGTTSPQKSEDDQALTSEAPSETKPQVVNSADMFVVELKRQDRGIGLGLIDGMHTPLQKPGIYVRTILVDGPAFKDGRLSLGDRLLSVNGWSLIGQDYHSAMKMIKSCEDTVQFVVSKADVETASVITTSLC